MDLASSYVIEQIYHALEEDVTTGHDTFEEFSVRYPQDTLLKSLYDKFKETRDNLQEIEKVKNSLDQLKYLRKTKLDRSYTWYLRYKLRYQTKTP